MADRALAILSEEPDLLGISVSFQAQMPAAFVLAGLIRRAAPRVCLVLGGSWITQIRAPLSHSPELLSCFDAVVPFEGEVPLLALIDAWAHNRDTVGMPGTILAAGKDNWSGDRIPQGLPIKDLPTPCFDGLPLHRYLTPSQVLPLASSRGCYWGRCAFCTHYVGQGCGFRGRPVDAVLADMTELEHRYGARHFYLVDEALPPDTIRHLPAAIANAGLDVRWASEVRLDSAMQRADPAAIRRSGACLLIFGLESGSQAVLDRMDKGIQLNAALRIIRNVAEAGISVSLFLMTGFPGETFDDWFSTLEFVEETAPWVAHISLSAFGLTRDSRVARTPGQYGVRYRQVHQPI